MNLKHIFTLGVLAATASALAATTPEVSNVTMTQATSSRLVTITYTLANAPAVVTLDVQTNATDGTWHSIGGAAVCNAQGDVWKKISANTGTITWRPDLSWPDHKIADGGARAVVTAWSLDNTPDYMAVDISDGAQPNTQTYYPSADFVPGGVIDNTVYRMTKILMRKIMAKDVEWTMGSHVVETQRTATREATHQVTLTNNYYIGVFQVTQAQWALIQTARAWPSYFYNSDDRAMRPVEQVCYNEIRNAANSTTENATYNWPANPNPSSFLGLLRTKTGIDFDLPSEAQWEFAARAGHGSPYRGDGKAIKNTNSDVNMDAFGRYQYNGGKTGENSATAPAATCTAENGTAVCGSYAPNDWGLYDTCGNVWEWCLDWYADDISAYNGKVNIDPKDPANTLATPTASGSNRVSRGGSWIYAASYCRPASRPSGSPSYRSYNFGLRLLCSAGLQ